MTTDRRRRARTGAGIPSAVQRSRTIAKPPRIDVPAGNVSGVRARAARGRPARSIGCGTGTSAGFAPLRAVRQRRGRSRAERGAPLHASAGALGRASTTPGHAPHRSRHLCHRRVFRDQSRDRAVLRAPHATDVGEFFLSGGKAPWWLTGTSMVATTFAVDTPLAVTGFVAQNGIAGNWLWWNMAASGLLTVFFFAALWRRSGVLTDVEFIELRYGGKARIVAARRARRLSRRHRQHDHHGLGQPRDGQGPLAHAARPDDARALRVPRCSPRST